MKGKLNTFDFGKSIVAVMVYIKPFQPGKPSTFWVIQLNQSKSELEGETGPTKDCIFKGSSIFIASNPCLPIFSKSLSCIFPNNQISLLIGIFVHLKIGPADVMLLASMMYLMAPMLWNVLKPSIVFTLKSALSKTNCINVPDLAVGFRWNNVETSCSIVSL